MMLDTICPSPEALAAFARTGTSTGVATHLENGCPSCGREIVELMERNLDGEPVTGEGNDTMPEALWHAIQSAHVDPANLRSARVLHLRRGPAPILSSADGATMKLAAAGGMRGDESGWSAEIPLPEDIRAWLILTSDELRVRATRDDRPIGGLSVQLRRIDGEEILDRVETDARGRARLSLEDRDVIVEIQVPADRAD